MNAGQPDIEKIRRTDDQHHLRLMALLDDLVGDNAVTSLPADWMWANGLWRPARRAKG